MACLCCGKWRIEIINLDGHQRYKVMQGKQLAAPKAYLRAPAEVTALLQRLGGPDLSQFAECD
jgi:hypothetical protein